MKGLVLSIFVFCAVLATGKFIRFVIVKFNREIREQRRHLIRVEPLDFRDVHSSSSFLPFAKAQVDSLIELCAFFVSNVQLSANLPVCIIIIIIIMFISYIAQSSMR